MPLEIMVFFLQFVILFSRTYFFIKLIEALMSNAKVSNYSGSNS